MRTPEERIRLIQKRTAELKRKKQRQKQWMIDTASTAACLLLVVGLSFCMPVLMDSFSEIPVHHASGAASIIGNHVWLGYIIIAVFSFLLGMSLTTLLYRLHRRNKRSQKEDTIL